MTVIDFLSFSLFLPLDPCSLPLTKHVLVVQRIEHEIADLKTQVRFLARAFEVMSLNMQEVG